MPQLVFEVERLDLVLDALQLSNILGACRLDEQARKIGFELIPDLGHVADEFHVDRPDPCALVWREQNKPSPRNCCNASRTGFVEVLWHLAGSEIFNRSFAINVPGRRSCRIRS